MNSNAFDDPDQFMMIMRPASEVAARCIILCCVLARVEDAELFVDEWLKAENLWEYVSPKESDFLLGTHRANNEQMQMSWRSEALLTLMWALRMVDVLPAPVQTISFATMLEQVPAPNESTSKFLQSAELRPLEKVIHVYEQTYEQHWQIRDARQRGVALPPGIEPGVVYERHYALNWLRQYGIFEIQEWDEVTTDT